VKISDYYPRSLLHAIQTSTKVHPVVMVTEDMADHVNKGKDQKDKRVSYAYLSGSQKIPKENSNVKGHNGVGVYLSIWA